MKFFPSTKLMLTVIIGGLIAYGIATRLSKASPRANKILNAA